MVGGALPLLISDLLQVTERLLDAEEQKLRLLKAEIEVARHSGGANPTKVSYNVTFNSTNHVHVRVGQRT